MQLAGSAQKMGPHFKIRKHVSDAKGEIVLYIYTNTGMLKGKTALVGPFITLGIH